MTHIIKQRNLYLSLFLGLALLFVLFGRSSASNVLVPAKQFEYVRSFDMGEAGIRNPAGLAYSPAADGLLSWDASTLNAPDNTAINVVHRQREEATGLTSAAVTISDPASMAFDRRSNALFSYEAEGQRLVQIQALADGLLDASPEAITTYDLAPLELGQVEGLAFDPNTGDLFILDAAIPAVVKIAPGPGADFDGQAAIDGRRVGQIALDSLGKGEAGAVAFNTGNGRLYVLASRTSEVHEVSLDGQPTGVMDLSALGLSNASGMTFAPSGDATDDPAAMSLFIADRGQAGHQGLIHEAMPLEGAPARIEAPAMANIASTLVQIIDTSQWSPPSPDASGVVYNAALEQLWVVDSEVNEVPVYVGDALYTSTLGGELLSSHNVDSYSNEPSGIGLNPGNGHLFIADDTGSPRMLYEVDLGPDEAYGTADDVVSEIPTEGDTVYSTDNEGVAYAHGKLYVAGGIDKEIYVYSSGSNGVFDGVPPYGDDQLDDRFDVTQYGFNNAEGVGYNPDNDTILVVSTQDNFALELALDGSLVNTIDWSATLDIVKPAGVTYGPRSDNPAARSLYIADRGIDNSADANENDGKVYEITYGASVPNPNPTINIVTPAAAAIAVGPVTIQINASDAQDAAGTLNVQWNIDGGAWMTAVYNGGSGYYEAGWNSAGVADGPHTINAQATDGDGNSATDSSNFTVDNISEPPLAAFTFDCLGTMCQFDSSGSVDPDGSIVSYDWVFGDGNGSSDASPSHTFAAAGSYSVTLTVTDDDGQGDSETQNVSVEEAPPTMHVGDIEGAAQNSGRNWQAQVTVVVHDVFHQPLPSADVALSWSGDVSGSANCTTGANGACSVTTATAPKKGSSGVIFVVGDVTYAGLDYTPADNHDPNANSSGSAIEVQKDGSTANPGELPNQPPTASFTYSCDAARLCSFDASGSGDADGSIVSYEWDFGDGNGGSGANASHTYGADGIYQVSLTVTDDGGDSDSQSRSLTLGAVPTLHVGDLDASTGTARGGKWNAVVVITVHDGAENALAGATVNIAWSGGASGSNSCTTDAAGQCSITSNTISKNQSSATLTVTSVTHAAANYDATNHDPDGDSDGTTILVLKP